MKGWNIVKEVVASGVIALVVTLVWNMNSSLSAINESIKLLLYKIELNESNISKNKILIDSNTKAINQNTLSIQKNRSDVSNLYMLFNMDAKLKDDDDDQ